MDAAVRTTWAHGARWVGVALVGVAALLALAGFAFISATWPFVWGPHLMFLATALVAGAGGWGVMEGHRWAWGVAWGMVGAGVVYALYGLSRQHSAGFVGLALWGFVAYALLRREVRDHCRVGW